MKSPLQTSTAPLWRLSVLSLTLAAAGCTTSTEGLFSSDKNDYRSGGAKTAPLEVPPDLTQLARDSRYQPQGGVVSANAMARPGGAPAAQAAPALAPNVLGSLKIERQGTQRWLVTGLTPEQLWPQLRTFWQERGFTLAVEDAAVGVMETEWAEDRTKLPQDIIRRTLGRLGDGLYSTGLRDRFRTRVERTSAGSEVYISHRGMEEVYIDNTNTSTTWRPRISDPSLEAENLARLMAKLGAPVPAERAAAVATVTQVNEGPARARALSGRGTPALEVDESFDRAWRRVGLALDRSGFSVEDRDRSGGLYFVRYVDPKSAGAEEPGFFSRLFGKSDAASSNPTRYRIAVKAEGDKTVVSVQNSQGGAQSGDIGERIAGVLLGELK